MGTEPKRIWDNFKEIGEVQKSTAIKIVVAAAIRDGVKYINLREFYKRKTDNVWKPGRDGLTIPLEVPIENGTKRIVPYTGIADALTKAAEVLNTMELYDESAAVYMAKKE